MIDYHQLARAMREADDRSDVVGFDGVLNEAGVDKDGIVRAAEQRAMRYIVLQLRKEELDFNHPFVLRPGEQPIYLMLTATWIDGALTGIRVKNG